MQRYTIFFITVNALHVSGGFSAHHQELKTVLTASGICQACLLLPLAVAASKRYTFSRLIFVRSCLLSFIVAGTAANQFMSLQYIYPRFLLILFRSPLCSSTGIPIKIEYTFLVWSLFGAFICSYNPPTIAAKPVTYNFENPLRTFPPSSFYFISL
jgi:hypothetical protein